MTDNEVRALIGKVERLLVAQARLEEKVDGIKDDINNLNSFRDWAVKIVVGAVIVSLLGLVLVQGGTIS